MAIVSSALDPLGGSVYVSTDDQFLDPFGGSLDLITVTDVSPPSLSNESVTEAAGPTTVDIQFDSTEEGTGYYWITTNATETNTDVKTSGTNAGSVSVGTNTISGVNGWVPGVAYYAHIVVEDAATNLSATSSPTLTTTHYSTTATYSGGAIPSTSVLYITDGSHTGADSTTVLEDSTASWTVDAFIGLQAFNVTDTAFATITDNDDTTATHGALSGGGTWNSTDVYQILIIADSPDVIYHQPSVVITGEAGSLKFYIKDDTDSSYSGTETATLDATGLDDGTYDVTMDELGTPTLTLQVSGSGGGDKNSAMHFPMKVSSMLPPVGIKTYTS